MTNVELLAEVNAAISALIASPQVDYTEGDVSVSAGQKMEQLLRLRDQLKREIAAGTDVEAAEITAIKFHRDIDAFGKIRSEVVDVAADRGEVDV